MPIGAAIGGAAIAGVGSVAAGALSAGAEKSAAKTAADSSLQVAQLNDQLLKDTRNQNLQIAAPFYNNGVAAGNALQALLLGTPTAPATTAPTATLGTGTGALSGYQTAPVAGQTPAYSGPALSQIMTMPKSTGQAAINNYLNYYQAHPEQDPGFTDISMFHGDPFVDETAANGVLAARNNYLASNPTTTSPVPSTTPTTGTGTAAGALSAFDQFRNSTNYQWSYDQGLNALRGQYATRGALDSGAAEKAAITYGANTASNELGNYMNLLASQQAAGLTAADAVMGVNTNYAGNVTAQNTNAANTAANAALTSGQATANMWGTVGNTAGQLGGALFQYGIGKLNTPAVPTAQNIQIPQVPQFGAYQPTGYGF